MSGFFGIIGDGQPSDKVFLKNIADKVSVRGPDGTSVWARGSIGGCFALMRTGPAAQANHQPVCLGERFLLWGDIRLDARKELQEQLGNTCASGASAETNEELLLRAWSRWGATALEKVIGDFSFALWDAQEGTLYCARDFIGARPFYYAHVKNVFCFANSLEVLLQVPEISDRLDELFIADFLLDGSSLDPAATVYRDIRRLPAGHTLRFAANRAEVWRFRKLPIEEPVRLHREEEYTEAYLELFKIAICDRLPSGPTALYLSGGIDSSSVCAITAQVAATQQRKGDLRAFTLNWEPFVEDLESPLAKVTADHLGIDHEVLSVLYRAEQRMCRQIAAHSNVVLSGDGGDDILMGQSWPYLSDLASRGDWSQMIRVFGGFVWSHQRFPPLRGGFRGKIRQLITTCGSKVLKARRLSSLSTHQGTGGSLKRNLRTLRSSRGARGSNFAPVHPASSVSSTSAQ